MLYHHNVEHATVSKELFQRATSDKTPLFILRVTYSPSDHEETLEYYDVGGDVLFKKDHSDDDGTHAVIVESLSGGITAVKEDIVRLIRFERGKGTGDDMYIEAGEGYENIGPLPTTIEREEP
jgi:hypothetical protein